MRYRAPPTHLGCLAIAVVIVVAMAIGLPIAALGVGWIWGILMVPIFGLPQIDFWQALAIVVALSLIGSLLRRQGPWNTTSRSGS